MWCLIWTTTLNVTGLLNCQRPPFSPANFLKRSVSIMRTQRSLLVSLLKVFVFISICKRISMNETTKTFRKRTFLKRKHFCVNICSSKAYFHFIRRPCLKRKPFNKEFFSFLKETRSVLEGKICFAIGNENTWPSRDTDRKRGWQRSLMCLVFWDELKRPWSRSVSTHESSRTLFKTHRRISRYPANRNRSSLSFSLSLFLSFSLSQ